MEFSFDEIKGISPENKILYKDFMKKILKSGDIGKLESTLAYRKGQGERKNGNGDGREYKRTIESKLMKKIGINNYFNIFLTGNFTLSLKHKKAKP